MLMRREVWDRVNGRDENYGLVYGAADLCMRIRETGALVVWTPFAELYAGEAGSGQREAAQKRQPPESERIVFRNRWKAELEKGDPYFNPNFDQHRTDFAVDPSVRRHDAN